MGNFSKLAALLVATSAGAAGSAMPKGDVARRGEPTSNFLLGPLTSCVPPKYNQTCVTNGTHYHVYGPGGPEYAVTADGRTTTYINPKTPPTSIPTWLGLAVNIVGFCMSAVFCSVICAYRRPIYNAASQVGEGIRASLLGPTSRADARINASEVGVEMVVAATDHRSNNEGSRTSSSNSNHSPSATLGHPTAAITEGTERTERSYRNV